MRNPFFFLLFIVLLFSCSGKKKAPGGILSQKEMESVLWDLFRADEFLTGYVLPKDTALDKRIETVSYYEEIFKIHNTSKSIFQKSFSYYQSHPRLMKEILDSLSAKGSVKELEFPVLTDSVLIRKKNPVFVQ